MDNKKKGPGHPFRAGETVKIVTVRCNQKEADFIEKNKKKLTIAEFMRLKIFGNKGGLK